MIMSISLIAANGRMTPPKPQTSRFLRSSASAPSGRYRTPHRATGMSSGMTIALKITAERIADVGECRCMTSIAFSHGNVPANLLRRQDRIEGEQPDAAGQLEIGVGRDRLDFGGAHQGVTRIMADLDVLDLARLRAGFFVGRLTVVKAQVVVIAGDRAEDVVPDDLLGDLGVVRIDQRERLAGDVTDQAPVVLGKEYLRGIFLGRILVRRWPIDALGRYDLHGHPVLDFVVHARRHEFFDLPRVAGGYKITRLHLRGGGAAPHPRG